MKNLIKIVLIILIFLPQSTSQVRATQIYETNVLIEDSTATVTSTFKNSSDKIITVYRCFLKSYQAEIVENNIGIDEVYLSLDSTQYSTENTFIANNGIEYGEISILRGSNKDELYYFLLTNQVQQEPGSVTLKEINIQPRENFNLKMKIRNEIEDTPPADLFIECSNSLLEPEFITEPFQITPDSNNEEIQKITGTEQPAPTTSEVPEPTELITPDVTEQQNNQIDNNEREDNANSGINFYIVGGIGLLLVLLVVVFLINKRKK